MRALLVVGLVLAVVVLAGYLTVGNSMPIRVELVFATLTDVPLWQALIGAFALGVLLTAGICGWPLLRLRLRVRRQNKSITALEREIHGLRTLPLEEELQGSSPSAQEN